jgi:hypothetical protein
MLLIAMQVDRTEVYIRQQPVSGIRNINYYCYYKAYVYLHNRQILVAWLVGDNF